MAKKYQPGYKKRGRRCAKVAQILFSVVQKYRLRLLVATAILASLVGLIVMVGTWVSAPSLTIGRLDVVLDPYAQLYDTEKLVSYWKKDFENKNAIRMRFAKWSLFRYYKRRLPWIEYMNIDITNTGSIMTVRAHQPVAYLQLHQSGFLLSRDVLFPVSAEPGSVRIGDELSGSLIVIPRIEVLASEYSGTGLIGVFYEVGASRFAKQIQLITNNITDYQSLAYIPGAGKLRMTLPTKQDVYFDLQNNVIAQLDKLRLLFATGAMAGFRAIDVGTMDDSVFLSK